MCLEIGQISDAVPFFQSASVEQYREVSESFVILDEDAICDGILVLTMLFG